MTKMKTKVDNTHINVLLLENHKLKWLLCNNQDIDYNTYSQMNNNKLGQLE